MSVDSTPQPSASPSGAVPDAAAATSSTATAAATEPVLEVENLTVSFHTVTGVTHAVRGVSWALERGRTLALVGESGSGKSVTSYAAMRLIQPPGRITGGRLWFRPTGSEALDIAALDAEDPRLRKLRGGKISMIFQEPMTALSPVHTVGNQVTEALRLHKEVSKKEAWKQATEMLDRVRLREPAETMRKYPFELSGGMRQRVVIAMALITRPEVVIADEPTTALDVTVQAQVLGLLNELKDEFGTSVLFITHDLGVVAQIADDVAVMKHGRVVETGSVRDIVTDPRHPYTRALMDAMPRLGGHRERASDRPPFPLPPGRSIAPPPGTDDLATPEYLIEAPTGPEDSTRTLMVWPDPSRTSPENAGGTP